MSEAAAAGSAADDGAHSPINITTIPSTTHLFFDDENEHIKNVNKNIEEYKSEHPELPIELTSILCPVGNNVVLVKSDGTPATVTNLEEYSRLKVGCFKPPTQFVRPSPAYIFFRDFFFLHEKSSKKPVGSGFTADVIRQIIEFETSNPRNQRLYFFDFDFLLSLPGTFVDPTESIDPADYAHFLFSDYVQKTDNPQDRLNLLKEMFRLIGRERVYIITCNPAASQKEKTRRSKFIAILSVLLPNLIEDHVKFCSRRISESQVVKDKGYHIVEFIKAFTPSSGGSIKRRRMSSKKIKKTRYGRSRKYTRNLRRNKYRK